MQIVYLKTKLFMQEYRKLVKIASWTALLFCMLIISKYILFKKSPPYYRHYFAHEYKHYTVNQGLRQANLRPFHTITLFSSDRVSSEYSYMNIGGNIIGFIPLGVLLPIVLPFFRRWWRLILAVFIISLSYETVQLLTGVGIFDVDDLLLNTTGGIIGFILFAIARRLLAEPNETAIQAH
ncbi:MAG: VanZ family protein [Bacteroidetes bacterium]|jgi:glycopeptide antibiotics resistance protein|nr:MAG: VanZ family protein [Bacteroidota bacterium]